MTTGIAVDGSCPGNPGPIEFRGIDLSTGEVVFERGPIDGGTNNVAEFLAIVLALAHLKKNNDFGTPVYTDSQTAMAWVRRRKAKITSPISTEVREMVTKAETWLKQHNPPNIILKWNTQTKGEIAADYGRKR